MIFILLLTFLHEYASNQTPSYKCDYFLRGLYQVANGILFSFRYFLAISITIELTSERVKEYDFAILTISTTFSILILLSVKFWAHFVILHF